MQIPVQIAFRDFPPSDAVAADIKERVAKLESIFDRITGCRVVVESAYRRHRRGNHFHIRVSLTVPGEEIIVGRTPALDHAHKDVYVAIRDAFMAVQRQLQDYVRRRRVRVHLKHREGAPHARVSRILWDDGGYGFLTTADGREVYFHSHSVLGEKFETLEIGTEVRFNEERGEDGPQASTVEVIGKDGKHELPRG